MPHERRRNPARLVGLLRTGASPPGDDEARRLLEEELLEKYAPVGATPMDTQDSAGVTGPGITPEGREARQYRSVLIVDDTRDAREGLADVLGTAGVPVLCAANGEEALAHLAGGALPGLILLDLMMPVMSGWEFRSRLQERPEWAAIPIVVMSGVDDVHRQVTDLQVDGYLRKPLDMRILLDVVNGYCLEKPEAPGASSPAGDAVK
jgi:CheY-like chemotaxis protein